MRVDDLNVSRRCRSNGCPVPAQDDVMVRTETFRQTQRRQMREKNLIRYESLAEERY
jgi:hypothetical protein